MALNHREQASLDVLQERMTNLIARVDSGFAEQKVDTAEQGRKIDEASSAIQRLGIRMDNVESTVNDHKAADEIVHHDVKEHIDAHKRREYVGEGRQDALAWIDKAIMRVLVPLAVAGAAIYAYLTK